MHRQMITPIEELNGLDPSASIAALALPAKIATNLCAMTGDELADRLMGDPAAGMEMLDELADARRYVAALAGLLESAELRLLSALS